MAAVSLVRSLLMAIPLAIAGCGDAERSAGEPVTTAAGTANPDRPVSAPAQHTVVARTPDLGPAHPSDCNAPRAERFIGHTADPATRAELTAAVAPITAIRWVGPGDATTEDYSPQRLNVMLDAGGEIVSAHCG